MDRLRNLEISARTLGLIVLSAVAVLALVGWFGLVSPQRSKASELNGKIADANQQLHVAKVLASVEKSGSGKKSGAALLRVAMPDNVAMPAVLKEVQSLASSSKVSLDSFAPSTATALNYYDSVPINVSVGGRYADVKGFLRRLRLEAGSVGSRIHASGRLYDVGTISLAPGAGGAPELTATIELSVFVYTGQALAPPTTTTDTTTTGGS